MPTYNEMSHKPVNVIVNTKQWQRLKMLATYDRRPLREVLAMAIKLYLAQERNVQITSALDDDDAKT